MKIQFKVRDVYEWHSYFAWLPHFLWSPSTSERAVVWLERIRRKRVSGYAGDTWEYKFEEIKQGE